MAEVFQQGAGVTSLFSHLSLLTRVGKTYLFVGEDRGVTKAGKKLSFFSRFYIRENYAAETDSKVKTRISWPGKQAARS